MQVAVVGSGYVGLVTGVCLAEAGHRVACIDLLPERVEAIHRGEPPFHEPGLAELLRQNIDAGRFVATIAYEPVREADVAFIAVGTPTRHGSIDLSAVEAAAAQIGQTIKGSSRAPVVTVKSTVVPGTTDTLVRGTLERILGPAGRNFGLCMNPEFLREGSAVEDFQNPDRIVIGQWDERSGQTLRRLYASFTCPMVTTTLRNAELIKYANNALLATLVSFSNELAAVCEATPGTDIDMVLDGVHLDRRLAPLIAGQRVTPGILSYLRAGVGFGGSCLPKDVAALSSFAARQGADAHLLNAVLKVNFDRPRQLVSRLEEALGGLQGVVVGILGLAFKPGADDVRDSPALTLARLLRDKGAVVRGYDPMVKGDCDEELTIVDNPMSLCADADAVLIATAWPEFRGLDWTALLGTMRRKVIVDGRNLLRGVPLPPDASRLTTGVARAA